ncbi:transglycosylase domain-containing protein [Gandjariella thermophila]|nr:transglycosylase domain-containing protein [Gandjariella thermophila]
MGQNRPRGRQPYWRDAVEPPYGGPAPWVLQQREAHRRRLWRRIRRASYVLAAAGILGPIAAFVIAYQFVDVPSPAEVAASQNQVVTLYYADGTEMTKIIPDGGDRTLVRYQDVPEQVRHAVLAAEDATFETNPGFDIAGIARAAFNNLSGGTGGGSTITQQYIKNATSNDQHTLTRKFFEVVKAYKMNNQQSKQDILTAYLNTIYFGRGANGIQAAAHAYYGTDVQHLTAEQAAMIAGMIQRPSDTDQAFAERRWNFVMDQMVKNGWLSPTERQSASFPQPLPRELTKPKTLQGPDRLIQDRVMAELDQRGIPEDQVQHQGMKIFTTIDRKAQQSAKKAVTDVMNGQPDNLRQALVAVDPRTGGVRAYVGSMTGTGIDYAMQPQEPGSSFKPFDLVAALEKGHGIGEAYDGSSPRTFAGLAKPIRNSENVQCPFPCGVREAMRRSINTVFMDMVMNVTGTQAVANAAHQAGIPETIGDARTLVGENGGAPDANIAIGGGRTQVRPFDMASAYATFAADGVRRAPHFVAKAEDSRGNVVYQTAIQAVSAFDQNDQAHSANIARNVTETLLPIPGASNIGCTNSRPCAGKTGTQQFNDTDLNAKAWMVGYTPSISAAAWVGTDRAEPIMDSSGKTIFGSGLPGHIWQAFMNTYLAGTKVERFPKASPIGQYQDVATAIKQGRSTNEQDKQNQGDRNQQAECDNPFNLFCLFEPDRKHRRKDTDNGG